LQFQWDNLLVECGVLAAFVPWQRPAPRRHLLMRLLLFKLYFESGLAKWQSPLGDWRAGTALSSYFETAPLPTFFAWYAHHLPPALLRWASWATLVCELGLPLLFFCGRRARLVAAAALTAFQLANGATANYGFFVFLASALHLFLLDDRDVDGIERDIRRSSGPVGRLLAQRFGVRPPAWRWPLPVGLRRAVAALTAPWAFSWRQAGACAFVAYAAVFVYVSLTDALLHFGPNTQLGPPLGGLAARTHTINTYRLFAAVTTVRIEPEIQVDDGSGFVAALLWHKPGDLARAPNFVAPHQPRLDFQLWFAGLRRDMLPPYLHRLARMLCEDPKSAWPFFRPPLPAPIQAVRIVYWRYTLTSAEERRQTGHWWARVFVASHAPMRCHEG
jgi:uncharacterized membrane protein YphA (DoxX/SURF4 family)